MSIFPKRFAGKLIPACIIAVCGSVCGQEPVIEIHADRVLHPLSRLLTGACIEDVNHEIYGGLYSQMVYGESFQEPAGPEGLSGMWRPVTRGMAKGAYAIETAGPFAGAQSQRVSFESGQGLIGMENEGLNHWGMNFVAGKPYKGLLQARTGHATTITVALESRDGSKTYAQQEIALTPGDWRKVEFTLTPNAADTGGRLMVGLAEPGTVTFGYVFLQPGEWGRFKRLPVRKDVAEGMIRQGIRVLRYGGSMVNAGEYRWKKMIGPRDRRPPYHGTWYPFSSNGWGIPDFMSFAEAAGFEYVPAFNMDETPQDMADFAEYATGPAASKWGAMRATDGHPAPYALKYMELGNEERVDQRYAEKFERLARAIWSVDPQLILVVGDFGYQPPIADPFHFTGSSSGITSLAAHQEILQFAKRLNGEVWFDVHVNTDVPAPSNASLLGVLSFYDALDKIADGARHKVVVFELNAGNHAVKRALANAQAILAIERDGRLPIVTSANGLQPDGQNNNGWDQGLLFLNPSQVWLQPPGYVTQMLSDNYLPDAVQCDVQNGGLDAAATRSADGKTLVLQVVNPHEAMPARIILKGMMPAKAQAQATVLTGPFDAVNTAAKPYQNVPQPAWTHEIKDGETPSIFPENSFTVIRFQ